MLKLTAKIKIDKYVFSNLLEAEIIDSFENFTNTATIKFKNAIYYNQSGDIVTGLDAILKKTQPVWIYAGYNKTIDELPLLFSGFVSKVNSDYDLTVMCEDYMFVLKQVNIPSKSFVQTTLGEVIDYILTGINIDVNYQIPKTTEIGDFVIDNKNSVNAVQVLEELRNNFNILSYFKDNILQICKISYNEDTQANFIFQHNIISNDLVYRKQDDINLVLKGQSMLETNEKIEKYAYNYGDEIKISSEPVNGEQKTLTEYNLTESQLEESLLRNFDKYYYKGYFGTFDTFLEPTVKAGDKVYLYDLKFKEKNSTYRAKSVVTKISTGGAVQTIELDRRIL